MDVWTVLLLCLFAPTILAAAIIGIINALFIILLVSLLVYSPINWLLRKFNK